MIRRLGVASPLLAQRTARAAVTALALAALLGGCRDNPLSPEVFTGEYELVSAGGSQLPLLIAIGGDTQYVWSERLTIQPGIGAHFELIGETRHISGAVSRYTFLSDWSTRVVNNHLVLTLQCPINANCVSVPMNLYREQDGGVRLERSWTGTSLYTRVASPE